MIVIIPDVIAPSERHQMTSYSSNLPPYNGQPERAVRVWWLKKGRKQVTCELWSHPIGGELRVEVDGELLRSEASRDIGVLVDRSVEWERSFAEKGWTR
jgi:hypothetical protein